jgi:hypothetical protein
LVDRLAFGLGFVISPLLIAGNIDLALLWTGLGGGSLAYLGHRLWSARRRPAP